MIEKQRKTLWICPKDDTCYIHLPPFSPRRTNRRTFLSSFFSFLFSFSISVRFNYVELIVERYSTQMLQLFLALANIRDRGKGKARKRRFFPNCFRNFSMDFPSENHEIPFQFSLFNSSNKTRKSKKQKEQQTDKLACSSTQLPSTVVFFVQTKEKKSHFFEFVLLSKSDRTFVVLIVYKTKENNESPQISWIDYVDCVAFLVNYSRFQLSSFVVEKTTVLGKRSRLETNFRTKTASRQRIAQTSRADCLYYQTKGTSSVWYLEDTASPGLALRKLL